MLRIVQSGLLAVLAAWLVLAPAAEARLLTRTVRLEGYVGKAPEGARAEARWTVDAGEQKVDLIVTRLSIVSGTGTPSDVVQALKPYRAAAFRIVGDEKEVAKLAGATAGSRFDMQGVLRLGPARTLLLSTLRVDP